MCLHLFTLLESCFRKWKRWIISLETKFWDFTKCCLQCLPQKGVRTIAKRCSFGSHLTTKLSLTLHEPIVNNPISPCRFCHCRPRGLSCLYFPLFYAKWIAEQVTMSRREIAFFSGFLFLQLSDAQRVILLSCITRVRALQAQVLMLKLLQLYIIVMMATLEQLSRLLPLLLIVRIIWDVSPKVKIWSTWIHD